MITGIGHEPLTHRLTVCRSEFVSTAGLTANGLAEKNHVFHDLGPGVVTDSCRTDSEHYVQMTAKATPSLVRKYARESHHDARC